MKPEDALELLDRAVAQINGPRQAHVQLQQAVECLRNYIADSAKRECADSVVKEQE